MTTWRARVARRIVRALLRLYPADFRRRFGADVEAELERLSRRDPTRTTGPGASGAAGLVWDAFVTLIRAWRDHVLGRRGRPAHDVTGTRDPDHVRPGGTRPIRLASALVRDLRYALRRIGRHPLHAGVVVATLAVALGTNVAVFAVTHSVLLTSLPYRGMDRVSEVQPTQTSLRRDGNAFRFVLSSYVTELPLVEAAALYYEEGGATLVGEDGASRIGLSQVTAGFFRTLGVEPLLGRFMTPDETDAAVLSHDLWRSAFGADPDVLGRRLELSGHPYRVVGVAPPGVRFPGRTEMWLSEPLVPDFYGAAIGPSTLVRRTPDAGETALQAALRDRAAANAAENGQSIAPDRQATLLPLETLLRGEVRTPLYVLLGASVLVFLLGCLNIASVSVSRATGRLHEMHVRRSLGAGRGRLALQLLTESTVLAVGGALGAVATAVWAVPLLVRWLPAEAPGLADAGVGGGPVLGLVAAGALLAGLLTGALSALYVARYTSPARARDARAGGPGGGRLQLGLTVVQVALAVTLVIGAGLLTRSLLHLRATPVGFERSGVLTFQVRLPTTAYESPAARGTFATELRQRLATHPGVREVGLTSRLPFSEGIGKAYRVFPADGSEEEAVLATVVETSPGYFAALGVEVLEGRDFRAAGEPEPVAILGEGTARELFGDARAVGRQVQIRFFNREDPRPATVVGVVEDVRQSSVTGEERSHMYEPLTERPVAWLGAAVRTTGAPLDLVEPVRRIMTELDPGLAPYAFRTTDQTLRQVLATQEALARVSVVFGGVSLLLAALGVYGLLAQGVARRRREMGIRMALGAGRARVVGRIVLTGTAFAAVGAAVGLGASLAAAGLLEGLLHGVDARDPVTFVVVPLGTLAVAALATLVPARRAAGVDPAEALREE